MIAKKEEYESLRKAGRALGEVLEHLRTLVRPGITTAELDLVAEREILARGGIPAFLNYKPDGAETPYPAALCVSVNDEVVHGIPSESVVLTNGDIVSLDLGLSLGGYFVDSAITVCVGQCDKKSIELIAATQEATQAGISSAIAGGHIGDIGAAVEKVAKKYNLTVVEDLGGHATGRAVHEKPFIPNEGTAGQGEELKEGLVIAIEPMLSVGGGAIELEDDQWTYRMADGSRAAHVEHTILITKDGPEILTAIA